MSDPGIIHGRLEMKFLILFVLKGLTEPLAKNNLAEMVVCDDTVDYFEFCQALEELVASGHVLMETDKYRVSAMGRSAADVCQSGLPYAARMSAQNATLETLAKMRRESVIKSEVIAENGNTFLRCRLFDADTCIMSLDLFMVSPEQASKVRDKFNKNAEEIYNVILRALMT